MVVADFVQKETHRAKTGDRTNTRNSYKIHEGSLQDLRDQGYTDGELFESIAVASLFNFMDRMADALGAPVECLQEMMKQMNNS